jgi:uncharacterized damage-inducible protein DinB
MADDRDALIEHYAAMRAQLVAAIDGLSDAAMGEPSLDGWSVKNHLAHLAAWDELRASDVARISAGHESAWRMNDEQSDAYSALAHHLRGGLSVAQLRWELDMSRSRLIQAIRGATPRGLDGSLYGEAGLWSDHEAEHAGWIARWRQEKGL